MERDHYSDQRPPQRDAVREEPAFRANYYDYLTGLPSMTHFFELAEAGREAILEKGDIPVLLYMDFIGMKFYNTRHSFAEGDKLLRSFAGIISRIFGSENCCRIDADHFAAQTEKTGLEEKIQTLLREYEDTDGGKAIPLHVGVYLRVSEEEHVSAACDRARLACNALRSRYDVAVNYYSQDLNDEEERKQYIIENIDRAIEEKWIKVYYQAIIRIANDRVCNEEALSRWIDPDRGLMPPDEFIPALEESRLIYKLDIFVVEQVIEKIREMAEAGMYLIPQSVNLSRSDFDSCDIVEEICRRVDEAGIDHSLIDIEITESVIGSDFDFMKEQVERFQSLGFQVWMDDFGSGYSSLDVLQSIHFDLIKLDMRFMQQFDNSEEGKIILTELVKMAIGMGVETICEGVERPEQIDFLREIGCTKGQGFIFSKPIPFSEILGRVKSGKDIRLENPEEREYYRTIGRINLYDMGAITSEEDDSLSRFFDTIPMAIMEIKDGKAMVIRCNKSYSVFMRRIFKIDVMDMVLDQSGLVDGIGATFMGAMLRCSRDGNRALVDEPIDEKTTIHNIIRRVAVNPITGTAAIAVAVLTITEEKEDTGASFSDITKALSSDYINLYYVNVKTEQFIEYTPNAGRENLTMERRGDDFFESAAKDARLFIYKDDQNAFLEAFNKENVMSMINEHGTFTVTYRLMMNGKPTYVSMKAVRMSTDRDHIIIGVSNVDAQVRQKEAMVRLQAEETTYSRVNALTGGFICIYTVDPATGQYVEYSASGGYEGLGLTKEGKDLFAQAQVESLKHVYKDDVEKFQTQFTRENILKEIEKQGRFVLQYRMIINGKPVYVNAQAALVEEKDGPQLIIGINNVDDLVRREQDYERKLAAARSGSEVDKLTGVKNRTAYDNMSHNLAQQIEGGESVRYAIALCRVRDLLEVNDTRGKEAGNQLIRDACAIICNTFKHSPVFRVAGDQFAVIAQGHDYEYIDDLVVELESTSRGKDIAIVCGMAKYDDSGSVASVFARADRLCRGQEE